jgi:alpha-acetolactate decarboxylase
MRLSFHAGLGDEAVPDSSQDDRLALQAGALQKEFTADDVMEPCRGLALVEQSLSSRDWQDRCDVAQAFWQKGFEVRGSDGFKPVCVAGRYDPDHMLWAFRATRMTVFHWHLPESDFPMRLKSVTGLFAALATAGVLASAGFSDFVHFGNFKRMMHTGDTTGKVFLTDLPQEPGRWGVGATAGLKGEIVQVDGKLLVSLGTDPKGTVHAPRQGEQAVLFASGVAREWVSVSLPAEMTQSDFEAFLVREAHRVGLPPDQPFVFRVEGRFPQLVWHVVTGESPAAGHGASPAHGGHGAKVSHGVHGTPSSHGGHANKQSGMRVFDQPGRSGQLVGVHSGAALEGTVSHPGERTHIHFVDAELTVSGHVDAYSVGAGSLLKLPAPRR